MRSKRYPLFLIGLTALCAWTPSGALAGSQDTIYLGSVAMDVPATMVQRLTPLTTYLSRKTGLKVSFRASPNLGSAVNELGREQTQIAYLSPVAYIEAAEKFKVKPLVAPHRQGKSTFRLVVAVHQESDIESMKDLAGKSFALGDEKALLQRAVVVGSGINLHQFSRFGFLKHYDNIAKAVLHKDFDAGILTDSVYEKFSAQGLRTIYISPPLPSYMFAVHGKLAPEIVKKLRSAFLALKADNPEGRMILNQLDPSYEGFLPADDEDYETVRKLIAPFQKPTK